MKNHTHCPDGCEHPQPFRALLNLDQVWDFLYLEPEIEYEFCGRCWHRFKELTVMVPCEPPYCQD